MYHHGGSALCFPGSEPDEDTPDQTLFSGAWALLAPADRLRVTSFSLQFAPRVKYRLALLGGQCRRGWGRGLISGSLEADWAHTGPFVGDTEMSPEPIQNPYRRTAERRRLGLRLPAATGAVHLLRRPPGTRGLSAELGGVVKGACVCA